VPYWNVVEGPSLLWNSELGYYYLIYSANFYGNQHYHVGVARSRKLETYFEEKIDNILHTDYKRYNAGENCTFVGPGHGSPILDSFNLSWYYIYHAWKYDQVLQNPPGRVMNLDKINWNSEGWPIIGTGIPSDTPQNVPSFYFPKK